MRLTRYSDYALRVLMFLGVAPNGLTSIHEIAESYGISENHLMKVAHQLGLAGYIETVRGRNGGLRLARKPSEIGIGEVIRSTEEDLALVECFGPSNACPITSSCVLRGVVGEALAAFLAVLDRYTLADLLRPRNALADQLGLSRAAARTPPRSGSRRP
jgi:Rrf2 family transcriptional regulator, nitric oxide-sensitive transcriptional repressor